MVCGETLARLHEDLRMATWGAKGGGRAMGVTGEFATWVSLCFPISSPPRFLAQNSVN